MIEVFVRLQLKGSAIIQSVILDDGSPAEPLFFDTDQPGFTKSERIHLRDTCPNFPRRSEYHLLLTVVPAVNTYAQSLTNGQIEGQSNPD